MKYSFKAATALGKKFARRGSVILFYSCHRYQWNSLSSRAAHCFDDVPLRYGSQLLQNFFQLKFQNKVWSCLWVGISPRAVGLGTDTSEIGWDSVQWNLWCWVCRKHEDSNSGMEWHQYKESHHRHLWTQFTLELKCFLKPLRHTYMIPFWGWNFLKMLDVRLVA